MHSHHRRRSYGRTGNFFHGGLKLLVLLLVLYGFKGGALYGYSGIIVAIFVWIVGGMILRSIFPRKRVKSYRTENDLTENAPMNVPRDTVQVGSGANTPISSPEYVPIGSPVNSGITKGKKAADVLVCQICGTVEPDTSAKFCMNCGAKLA